jgi:O-antigen ligase
MNKKIFFQNALFWLLVGLVIFIPLYPKFPLFNVPGTYVTIRLEDFFITIVLLLWSIYQFKYNKRLVRQPLFQAFALFWFVGFVSLLSALFLTHSVIPHLGLLHWGRRLEYMLLFWVAATTLVNRQQVKILFWVFVLVTLVVVFYGFGQLFLGFKVVSTVDKDFSTGILSTLSPAGRVNSTFAGHYDLAIYLSYFLITVAGAWFYVKKAWQKIGIFLVGILSFILLAYTASRISFFGAIAGLVLVLWLLKRRIVLVALILFSIVLVMAVPQFRDRIIATINVNILNKVDKSYTPIKENKLLSAEEVANEKAKQGLPRDITKGESTNYTELEVGRSFAIRLTDEWPRALNALYKNPFLGTGYSSISLATDNDYLRVLGETGALGFISIAIIFVALVKHFVAAMNTSDMFLKSFYIVIIGIIINVLITALFIDVLEASKVACLFWILLGIAWSQASKKTL